MGAFFATYFFSRGKSGLPSRISMCPLPRLTSRCTAPRPQWMSSVPHSRTRSHSHTGRNALPSSPGGILAQRRGEAEVRGENSSVASAGGRVYNEFRAYEDYGMRVGVEDVWGSSPLRLARYARLFDEFPLDRMWRLTGVTHVLNFDMPPDVPTYLHRSGRTAYDPSRSTVVNLVTPEDAGILEILTLELEQPLQRRPLPLTLA